MISVCDHGFGAAQPAWAGFVAPAIMGILNVTPDSFSDGGDRLDAGLAIEAGMRMREEGADIVDVGGESTRPGATAVDAEEEQGRVLPVVAALARAGVVVSIDTRHAATMARALDAGARIVNDVSALAHDPAAPGVVAARRCPVVLMHMRGTPETMMQHAAYGDLAAEVMQELGQRVQLAVAAGVARAEYRRGSRVRLRQDRGAGCGTAAAARGVAGARLRGGGRTLAQAVDRVHDRGAAGEAAGAGSVAAALAAVARGARVVRVHDVAETRQALSVWQAVSG